MTRLNELGRRAAHGLLAGTLLTGLGLAIPQAAWAQTPPRLDERCVVSVLNRNVRVKPDGTWVLPNIPANFGLVRARATCIVDGQTVSGESAPFLISPNGSIDVPPIVLGSTTPIPQQVTVTTPAPQLGQVGQTVQVSVTARYADGTSREVSGAATGTRYVISNPAIATVTADGLVTARASGTVLIQATNEGTAGFTAVRVVLSADSDGDGIPDDLELTLGLNPNNPADAFEDADRDGLSNRDEALGGTDLRNADTDLDGLSDGEEVRPGADGFVTNPLSADTDGDGVRDALEVASGSDPTNAASTNLAQALTALTVTPASFTITVNSVLGVGSQQLLVSGQLRDGTTIDLTATTRGTNYASSDLDVCNFGSPAGRVFGSANGACVITITNAGFTATAQGTVTNFQPTALSSIAIPGYANNVDVNGGTAYVAAGSAGLVVVDVANPAAPLIVATVDTPGNANDVRVVGSRVYVADGSAGLRIYDATNPATPQFLGALDTTGDASDVIVVGDLAFVADGVSGVQIIDVSLPATPQLLRTVDTAGTARGVDAENGIVAVADDSGLRVIDATTPASAAVVGTLSLSGQTIDVDITNGFAVVASYTGGVHIVDVAQPETPQIVRTVDTPGLARGVDVDGAVLVVADDQANALRVVDLTTPASAGIVGAVALGGQVIDVDLANGIAVVAAYTGGAYLIDVRSPGSPTILANIPGSSPNGFVPRDVQVAGRFALFAEQLFANAVAPIVDIGDPAQPFFRGVLDFGQDYAGTGIAISGPHVYWTGQSFVVSAENGTSGTTRLFIGQYIAIEDRAGVPPAITIVQPPPSATAVEGSALTIRADATDDVAVASVSFTVNGSPLFTDTSEPFETRVTVPPAPGPMVIGAQAADYGGNTASAAAVSVSVIPDPLTTVTGRVVDRNAAVVSGATVTVLGRTTTSAADGSFLVANVPTVQGALSVLAETVVDGLPLRGRSAPAAPVAAGITAVGDIVVGAQTTVSITPADPAGASVGNCIPFGNNTSYQFTGFIYRDVPAFELAAGDRFAFDLGQTNGQAIRRNIYFGVANINPAAGGGQQGVQALSWVQVVTDAQTPENPQGDTIRGNYELTYTATAPFSFPGGGFIIGFGGSPPGSYADGGCEQVLVHTTSSDASGLFHRRFYYKPDLTLGVLDDGSSDTGSIGGVVIRPDRP